MSNAETTQQVIGMESLDPTRVPPPPYTITDPLQQSPVTNQPVRHETIIVQQFLKDEPIYVHCPSCHKRILTTIKFVNSNKTHLLSGFICGLTLWCLLCCLATLPYMLATFKTADHYCSNCNYYIGSYSKL